MLAVPRHRPALPSRTGSGRRRLRAAALRRFLGDRRGAAAVEFALVGLLIVTTAVGLIELAMILYVNSLMEGGLREAARYGVTGYSGSAARQAEVLSVVERHTRGLVDIDAVALHTLVYPGFADVGRPEPFTDANGNGQYDAAPAAEAFVDVNGNGQWDADMGAAGLGGPGDIVLYTLDYDWPLITGLMDGVIGRDGKMPLSASIVVRNEPFGAAGGGG